MPFYAGLLLWLILVIVWVVIIYRIYKFFRKNKTDEKIAQEMGWNYSRIPINIQTVHNEINGQKVWHDTAIRAFYGFTGIYQKKKFSLTLGDGEMFIQIEHSKPFEGFTLTDTPTVDLLPQNVSDSTMYLVRLEGNEFSKTFSLFAKDPQDPYYDINPSIMAKLLDVYHRYYGQGLIQNLEVKGINNLFTFSSAYFPLKKYQQNLSANREFDVSGEEKKGILMNFIAMAYDFEATL